MATQQKKNQHYVPQCYLRNFSLKKRCWVLDKCTLKIFTNSIRNVACEDFFYDTEVDKHNATNVIEDRLDIEVERSLSSVLKELLKNLESGVILDIELKKKLAPHIATLYLRTKRTRDEHHQVMNSVREWIGSFYPDVNPLQNGVFRDADNEFHGNFIFMEKESGRITDVLLRKNWLIFRNLTQQTIHASDHPVAQFNHDRSGFLGFDVPGVEVVLPLNSKFILSMTNVDSSTEESTEIRVSGLEDIEIINFYNRLQAVNSTRQIFSIKSDFEASIENLRDIQNSTK